MLDLFQSRWSPKSFTNQEVSGSDLRTVLEAARWAASSYNEQPWRFLVARRSDSLVFQKFLDLLVPANAKWAGSASVLIVTAAKKTFSHSGQPNYYALHDAGQALAQLLLQATALGLHAHAMGGFDHDKARIALAIPDDYAVGAAVALGYYDNSDGAQGTTTRTRKALADVVFNGTWDHSAETLF